MTRRTLGWAVALILAAAIVVGLLLWRPWTADQPSDAERIEEQVRGYVDDLARIDYASAQARRCEASGSSAAIVKPPADGPVVSTTVAIESITVDGDTATVDAAIESSGTSMPLSLRFARRDDRWCISGG
ncbi:Rv0361 family membrane protein [Gordonia spumicola]|uniref:Rv0361 family membrane protein n=1 Tax=Gordonia spumicola TaxID=589161 RepID=UPI00137B04E1|nr:hypothetical protein [Gordonia spumicola]